jgi:predicted RecB family endonuclease
VTLNETLKQLKVLGNAKVRAQNAKGSTGDNQLTADDRWAARAGTSPPSGSRRIRTGSI